jgi:hypothetical protein
MKDGIVSLSFSRAGNNIFIDGLPGRVGSLQYDERMSKEDTAADHGKRSFIRASINGRYGIKVFLFRMKDSQWLACWETSKKLGKIKYDPWDNLGPNCFVQNML